MGSDAVAKTLKLSSSKIRLMQKWLLLIFFSGMFLLLVLVNIQPNVPSFSSGPFQVQPASCREYAQRFHSLQSSLCESTVVLACHRKWCASWGYCEFCGGHGSRIRYALVQASMAIEQGVCLKIDAPAASSLRYTQDVIYRDRFGLLSEMFHFRAYGNAAVQSRNSWKGNVTEWTQSKVTVSHWTPNALVARVTEFAFDPCLFHTLMQPSQKLQREIQTHTAAMGKRVIGLHFRAGDALAFGIKNADARIASQADIQEAVHKMLSCAETLAAKLFPNDAQDVTFYLASDHASVKEYARDTNKNVYTIDAPPQSWMQHTNDDTAWLEIYLLSQSAGIVANRRIRNYHGSSDTISTFAKLAAKIGFMNTTRQFMECPMD